MPWCPKCKNEYVEGMTHCADCGSELVEELPQEQEEVFPESFQSESFPMEEETIPNDLRKFSSKGVYKDNTQKAAEFKDSGYTLLGVGSIGLLLLILMASGVLPFGFGGISWITYSVLGAMFFIFIVVGWYSMRSARAYKKEALSENSLRAEIMSWCRGNLTAEEIDAAILEDILEETLPESEEEKYFKRTEFIRNQIGQRFINIEEGFLDSLIDEFYPEVFGE